MPNLVDSLVELKYFTKTLQRLATKAKQDALKEEKEAEKYLKENLWKSAEECSKIVVQKRSEQDFLLAVRKHVSAIANEVQRAITMRQVMRGMDVATKGLQAAMKNGLDLEKIAVVMEEFGTASGDLNVATSYHDKATSSATAVGVPQDQVDSLMQRLADKVGVELQASMTSPEQAAPTKNVTDEEREQGLGERLRALRN
ncbi:Vacuolar-sorting protein SNF7 [Pseudocyphellaria aurata]|nr:Vacuolar-sorting protein SNF7 [Pseudocyphellaria aurata]